MHVRPPLDVRFNLSLTRGTDGEVKIARVAGETKKAMPALRPGMHLVSINGWSTKGHRLSSVRQRLLDAGMKETHWRNPRRRAPCALTIFDPKLSAKGLSLVSSSFNDHGTLFKDEAQLLDTFDPSCSNLLMLLPSRIVAVIATQTQNECLAALAIKAKFEGWTTTAIDAFSR